MEKGRVDERLEENAEKINFSILLKKRDISGVDLTCKWFH